MIAAPIYFTDKNLGEMLLREWGGDLWLFRLHADKVNWVSYRKATEQDLAALALIVPQEHSHV